MIATADPIARALDGMNAEGWDKFSAPLIRQSFQTQLERQRDEVMKSANLVAQTFATEAGRQVLDMLVRQVLLANQIRLPDERATLEEQALYAARREGQNSVIAMLLNAEAMARGAPPTIKEGT